MLGGHLLKSWSKTQVLTALSSGESEFYGALKASAEGLGALSILRDYGISLRGQVFGDASAALGIISRKGLGRTRHIDTGLLWVQETAATKRLEFLKVLGVLNPADLMTKYFSRERSVGHYQRLSLKFQEGRAEAAPHLNVVLKAIFDYDFDDVAEADEEEEELTLQVQTMLNNMWHRKWKSTCKAHLKGLSQALGAWHESPRPGRSQSYPVSHAAASDSQPGPVTLLTDGSAPTNMHTASQLNNTTNLTKTATNYRPRRHTHEPPDAYPEVTEVSTAHTLGDGDHRSTSYCSYSSSLLANLTYGKCQRRRSSRAEKVALVTHHSKPTLRAPPSQ